MTITRDPASFAAFGLPECDSCGKPDSASKTMSWPDTRFRLCPDCVPDSDDLSGGALVEGLDPDDPLVDDPRPRSERDELR
ncbi:MAG: hypothetical protein ACRDP4_00195 [Nocardioidaceae bacterium]